MPAKWGQKLLDFPPVTFVPVHHGIGEHPNILGPAPAAAGDQIHYVAGFTSESVPNFVGPSCKRAFESAAFM